MLKPKHPRHRSRWRLLWYPVITVAAINFTVQLLITWRQSGMILDSRPGSLVLGIFNQLAVYIVLVPAMQQFFAATGIKVRGWQAFSLIGTGLAVARAIPAGDYLVWRSYFKRYRGGIGAATHWEVIFYASLFASLAVIFLVSEVLALTLYPGTKAPALVGDLRYVPVALTIILLTIALFAGVRPVRRAVRRFAYENLGSRTFSPLGIIRKRKLSRDTLAVIAFASFSAWLIEAFTMWLCMRAVGLDIPPAIAVFGFAFMKVFTYLPIVPGGIGEVEAAASLFFAAYGFPVFTVLTGAVLYRLISYWAPLLLGMAAFILLRKGSAKGSLSLGSPVFAAQLHRR